MGNRDATMPERMTEERLAEIREESRHWASIRMVRELLDENDALRAELAALREPVAGLRLTREEVERIFSEGWDHQSDQEIGALCADWLAMHRIIAQQREQLASATSPLGRYLTLTAEQLHANRDDPENASDELIGRLDDAWSKLSPDDIAAVETHWEEVAGQQAIRKLREQLAEARLAAAVADGVATPEMFRDAGLLEGWELIEGRLEYRSGDVILARVYAEGDGGFVSFTSAGRGVAFPLKSEGRVPLAREADAAVRKLLASATEGVTEA